MFNLHKIAVLIGLGITTGSVMANSHDHGHDPIHSEQALRAILQCMTKVDNTLVINGCNLHLANGSNKTHQHSDGTSSANGLGNLILGYNVINTSTGTPEQAHSGSHNLVIGDGHNYQSTGAIIAGANNRVTSRSAVVAGVFNQVNGIASTVLSGSYHEVHGDYSIIFGGAANTIAAGVNWGSISAGESHNVEAHLASIVGGRHNTAKARASAISGGQFNETSGEYSVVVGGSLNKATARAAVVLGGRYNEANGEISTVAGGLKRSTTGKHDYRAGANFFSNQ
ncbi:hypothetical protein PCIT_a1398 [Pseudoalteromonas citrea]|uniref:Trimeric autotransporter adhesin YadA-like head domain-containing protein n=2 Tax=Pseudoalteromonas citrea TaxID=43655 RepID=A0AAD4AMB5_9GAMM|nr:hypothetical protein [Pseudoalteromonas citrea]KAF7775249.1 hypothetical protein PCIT_a1398 [Pseudoalteromonas citrea]